MSKLAFLIYARQTPVVKEIRNFVFRRGLFLFFLPFFPLLVFLLFFVFYGKFKNIDNIYSVKSLTCNYFH